MDKSFRNSRPQPWLGTAFWGWRIEKKVCFQLLNSFYASGFRQIDTATNYPIDKNPAHFRLAENILAEWILAHGVGDLKICQKIGSLNNLGGPEHLLNPSFLLLNVGYYKRKFGENLSVLMWHWDKRSDEQAIAESMEIMEQWMNKGGEVGFSGLEHPEIHARLSANWPAAPYIQMKHNLFQSAYEHYAPFYGRARFVVYGITAGGVKFGESPAKTLVARGGRPEQYRDALQSLQRYLGETFPERSFSFHDLGMIYALHTPGIAGVLLGPSSIEQLQHSLSFWKEEKPEAEGIYKALLKWKKNSFDEKRAL